LRDAGKDVLGFLLKRKSNMPKNIPSVSPGGKFRMLGRGRRGQQAGGFGLGPGGECLCLNCGAKISHQRGVPCYEQKCPKCGQAMTRNR